jgi:hypothetical protein
MMETFSMEVCRNTTERNHRYLEESLELVQAMGCTQAEAHMLVDYVYGRPVGDPEQEVGGAMVTLAALCAAADISMTELGNRELARCWQNIEKIRAKQAGKPKHSPLPGPTHPETTLRHPFGNGTRESLQKAIHVLIENYSQGDADQLQELLAWLGPDTRNLLKASLRHKCKGCGAEGEPGSPDYCSANCLENALNGGAGK